MRRVVFDIEADNLLDKVTKIHCISTVDVDTGEKRHYSTEPKNIEEGLVYLASCDMLIGHNICQYDLPALKKVMNWDYHGAVYDTMLSGNILFPEEGSSLEAWAIKLRLSVQKVQHEDWSVYSRDMGVRCDADVLINLAVYEALQSNKHCEMHLEGLALEQQVALGHASQVLYGVELNIEEVQRLITELNGKLWDLAEGILMHAPWKCRIKGVAIGKQEEEKSARFSALLARGGVIKYTEAFRKDKRYTKATVDYFEGEHRKVKGPYTKVELLPLNLNNPAEVKDLLLSLGWIPTDWNIKKQEDGRWLKTSPKLTEDSYGSLPAGLGRDIADYNTLKHRRNMLRGILERVRPDGKVSADAFTCGTPTARYRHSGAVCNIPRVTTLYGKEIRAVFGVGKYFDEAGVSRDAWQVGVDLSGIEARMLAHYLCTLKLRDAQKTADLILSPDKTNDFHSYNAKVWGCDRDTAKTCLYALTNQRM